MAAGVWLQLQDRATAHPLWLAAAGNLPEGTSPFGALSKAAGGFGLLTIALMAFRRPKPAEDPAQTKVTLYGVTRTKDATPAIKPRRPVDFHAKAQARATQTAEPKTPRHPKRRFGLLRAVAVVGIIALMVVIGLPLLNNAEGAASAGILTGGVLQSVSETVVPHWTRATAFVGGLEYEQLLDTARVVVQGAVSGQLEAQVRIGLCLMATVWLAMMLRATTKLLLRRRRRRPTLAGLQFS
jgi:hypothetical protein